MLLVMSSKWLFSKLGVRMRTTFTLMSGFSSSHVWTW